MATGEPGGGMETTGHAVDRDEGRSCENDASPHLFHQHLTNEWQKSGQHIPSIASAMLEKLSSVDPTCAEEEERVQMSAVATAYSGKSLAE